MSYFRKKLERRTYSQDRYYILIKRQKEGVATFNELSELDEIVNRVPDIREKVILENFVVDTNESDSQSDDRLNDQSNILSVPHKSIWARIRSFFRQLFSSQFHTPSRKFSAIW